LADLFLDILNVQNSNSSSENSTALYTESDGSVWQVRSWLNNNAKDPESIEYITWYPLQKTNDGGFSVRVKYRAKNSFGGYVIEEKNFFLNSSGTVIAVL
jgi:hypothetical protein